MRDSMRILFCIGLIIVVAFVCNFLIIQNKYREESVQQRADLFAETLQQAEEEVSDIDRILMSAIFSNDVTEYMDARPLSERWEQLDDMQQYAATLTTLNDSIVAVCVYDNENEIIAMHGSKYIPVPDDLWEENCKFSDQIRMDGDQNSYFYAAVPIYERRESGGYQKAGGIALLVDSARIQEILNFAISGYRDEEVYFAVLDREGNPIAAAGNYKIPEAYSDGEKETKNYLYYEAVLALSDWKLVAITHKQSYMGYMNYVQGINLATYISVVIALAFLWYMMYFRVIVPLKRQMNFVMNYTKDTSQRMNTGDKYEVGKLEKELNEMLDGIEELNQKILEERERYQKLEYEKKQTEIIAYKNQINPHFLHNTLECIRGMALYKGEREIAKLTEAMSRMFQYNIRGGEIVSVKEMLRSIRDYGVIIEYRFMGKISIEVCAEPSTEECMLPKMLIQPLVENAVRHGVQRRVEGGCVALKISDSGEKMEILIQDTGVGMDEETCERQRAKFRKEFRPEGEEASNREIGVLNVARRLYLFYQDAYEVELQSEEGKGTAFLLILPKKLPE